MEAKVINHFSNNPDKSILFYNASFFSYDTNLHFFVDHDHSLYLTDSECIQLKKTHPYALCMDEGLIRYSKILLP